MMFQFSFSAVVQCAWTVVEVTSTFVQLNIFLTTLTSEDRGVMSDLLVCPLPSLVQSERRETAGR